MPVIDGLELIRHVHESQFFPHFILISGYKEFEYARTALKYGVEDYLLKPVNETELNQILKKVCSEHNQMLSENTKIHIDMHENNYYFMNVISSFIAKVDRMRLLCGSVHFVCFPS